MTDQETCGACNGSRRMPRDPNIGTDQECFVCDGSGFIAAHEAKQATADCPECLEQARLLGMSAERELSLRAEIEGLKETQDDRRSPHLTVSGDPYVG